MARDEGVDIVRGLRGAPASVLWALTLADGPLTNRELQRWTRYSENSVTHALQKLMMRGWARPLGRMGPWEPSRRFGRRPADSVGESAVSLPGTAINRAESAIPVPESAISRDESAISDPSRSRTRSGSGSSSFSSFSRKEILDFPPPPEIPELDSNLEAAEIAESETCFADSTPQFADSTPQCTDVTPQFAYAPQSTDPPRFADSTHQLPMRTGRGPHPAPASPPAPEAPRQAAPTAGPRDMAANYEALRAAGIFDPAASRVARLPHVSPDYVWEVVEQVKKERKELGLAIWRMEHDWQPPAKPTVESRIPPWPPTFPEVTTDPDTWDYDANLLTFSVVRGAEHIAGRLAAQKHVTPNLIREHCRQAAENHQDVMTALQRIIDNEPLPETWIHDQGGCGKYEPGRFGLAHKLSADRKRGRPA